MSMSSRFIECPSCGALQEDFDDKRIANNFCSECDYPIFFDTFDESQRDSEDASARNRSPGVEGRSKQNWRECPACGEKNDRDALHCVRCGAVLLIPDDEEVAPENQEPEPDLEPQMTSVVVTNPGLIIGVIAGLLSGLVIGFFVGANYF